MEGCHDCFNNNIRNIIQMKMKNNNSVTYPGFLYRQKKHEYWMDGREMTGCTTIFKSSGDKSSIIQWAANLSAAHALGLPVPEKWPEIYNEVIARYGKLTFEAAKELDKFFPEFKEARCAHIKVRDTAGDVGKEAHKICEEYELKILDKSKYSQKALDLAQLYINWYDQNVDSTYFVEKPLFSRSMFLGGTPDGGFKLKDGKSLINDKKYKTSIYSPEPFWQVSAYHAMIKEMAEDDYTPCRLEWEDGKIEEYASPQEYLGSLGGVNWDGAVILLTDQFGQLNTLYRYAFEEDLETFKSALRVYRKIQEFKL